MTNYKIKKRAMVGGLSDASKSSKIKTEYSAKLISCMFRNITMLFPSLQKIPTFFTNPLLHLVESLPPITAKYSSDKTEKRGKFRNFEH